MSFGRPGGFDYSRIVNPPDRGSFPLDHEGECKAWIAKYMECLKLNESTTQECRQYSKGYLQCRMDNELMVKDDMRNLGFQDPADPPPSAPSSGPKPEGQ